LDLRVFKDLRVSKVHRATLDLKVREDHRVLKVI
jgi:hypothetical protein